MRLGSLTLESSLSLSPLAGYTICPSASRCGSWEEWPGYDRPGQRAFAPGEKTKALKLIETSPADRPLAVQLFGSVPEEMRDAAVYVESLGIASVTSIWVALCASLPRRRRFGNDD